MKNNHITDERLQAYLLKETDDATITEHLNGCSDCQKRLAAYQFLVDGMQKLETETFSFDVTILAMNRIMRYEKKKRKKQEFVFWTVLSGLFTGIASFSIPYLPAVAVLFGSTSVFTALLVSGTGIGVFVFLGFDLVQQYKKKEEQLFKKNLQPML